MRIGSTIGVLSLLAAFAFFAGGDAAQAKSSKKQCSHKSSCCSSSQCCRGKKGNDVGSVLWKRNDCKTEIELMKKAGMCNVVCGKGPITHFCPTDAAYAKLGQARLDDLKNDPEKLKAAMKYHVLNRKVSSGDIKAGASLVTSQGESLMTNVNNGKAQVDGCLIIEADIPASNGIVHIIDDVPLPERGK